MGLKELSLSGVLAVVLSVAPAFSDTISGSVGAGFQAWATNNLNENGRPYWDNTSMDGPSRNVGFYLTAPLPGMPGAVPFWGNSFNSNTDSGGSADQNFFFQKNSSSSTAILKLEVAAYSNVNEFGWYDISAPSILHSLFLGPAAAPSTNNFSPGMQYGFYIKTTNNVTYYTQSSLNPGGDTRHQHFAVFQDSWTPGAESYWIGAEDLSACQFNGNENNAGDYNDMLIHISALTVPEPSTAMLVLSGSLLIVSLARRRPPRRVSDQRMQRRRGAECAGRAST